MSPSGTYALTAISRSHRVVVLVAGLLAWVLTGAASATSIRAISDHAGGKDHIAVGMTERLTGSFHSGGPVSLATTVPITSGGHA
jgi:hypothetical protein